MVEGSSIFPVRSREGEDCSPPSPARLRYIPSGGRENTEADVVPPSLDGVGWEVLLATSIVETEVTGPPSSKSNESPPISGGSEVSARSGCSLKLTGPRRMGVDVVGGEILLFVVIISVERVRVDFADADPVVTTSVQEESVASSDPAVLDVAPVSGGGAAWHWFWASASAPSGGDCDCWELRVARGFGGMVPYATKARRRPLTAGRRHA